MLRRKHKKNKSDLDEALSDVDESLEDSDDDAGSGRKRRRKLPLLLAAVGGILAAVKLKKRSA